MHILRDDTVAGSGMGSFPLASNPQVKDKIVKRTVHVVVYLKVLPRVERLKAKCLFLSRCHGILADKQRITC